MIEMCEECEMDRGKGQNVTSNFSYDLHPNLDNSFVYLYLLSAFHVSAMYWTLIMWW